MTHSEPSTRTVAVCRACDSVYVAEQQADGTIRPIGVSDDCTCGEGDFCRISMPDDAGPTVARSSN
ncbi:hypothetical protein [Natronorubrum sulfidifaciens]|uniref:Uncharacterized protein n=1 Tax=Natronorubrum sulfidifaciens JCM 14089 TaxID=1230460 RepID=L9W502_9EURY|nr:hypothetical protein [Natronorubrum sulfidifaciens]ELY44515.1 hypothetical protein C495_11459 [Natronorubrum sulfidifaciens JCM 14089]